MKIKKIILMGPRTTREARFDSIIWNFLLPLQSIGYSVKFFDTSKYGDFELKKLIESFNPDLLFCIMTGDPALGKFEPWDTIKSLTEKGGLKTFNWFSDDSWRFDKWSSFVCYDFTACSTTELKCVEKYKNIGYDNIFYTNWHANPDLYSDLGTVKTYDISFVGSVYGDRQEKINYLHNNGISVEYWPNLSFEEMVWVMSSSKICLSFALNPNDPLLQPQSKQRPYEILAAGSFPLCEESPNLKEEFKDLVLWRDKEELLKLSRLLLKSPSVLQNFQQKVEKVFVENFTSQKRLFKLINNLEKL